MAIKKNLVDFDVDQFASRRFVELEDAHGFNARVVKRCRGHNIPQGVGVFAIDRIKPTEPKIGEDLLDLGNTVVFRCRRGRGRSGRCDSH